MDKIVKILVFLFVTMQLQAQELNATVTINSDKVPGSNKQVYETMQRSLIEFINQKEWTGRDFKNQERIECSFIITITEQPSSNEFKGNIQIQSSRPVYNSSYLTPILNFRDTNFSFRYTEYETLEYDPNSFDSNLVSIVTYYIYTIFGMDGDSFAPNGGTAFFSAAENVVNQAQQSGYTGWGSTESGVTRFKLIENILSGAFDNYRTAMYLYHLRGLDIMFASKADAKKNIAESLDLLRQISDRRPNANLVRVFMDAKADEIVEIFSGGPRYDTTDLVNDLTKMSPVNLSKWNSIN